MKKIHLFSLFVMMFLVTTFIVGCSSPKKETLFADRSAEDIAKIEIKIVPGLNPSLASAPHWKTLTEKEDIEAFVKYLQGATVLEMKKEGLTGGWSYGFDITDKSGNTKQYYFDKDTLRFNNGDDSQTVYKLSENYFKPLILMMEG